LLQRHAHGAAARNRHCIGVSLHNSDVTYTGMMSGGEGEQAAGAERVRELIQFELKIGSKIGSHLEDKSLNKQLNRIGVYRKTIHP